MTNHERTTMLSDLARYYDLVVDWEKRLDREMPLLRNLFEKELRALLERIGFEIVSTWSDYSGVPFDPRDSGDLLLLSRRPG